MSDEVWMSEIMSDSSIGDKVGLRHKFYGEKWEQPYIRHEIPDWPEKVMIAYDNYRKGLTLQRTDFPEASAVYDWKCFKRRGELLSVNGFYGLRSRLADVFGRFDLGDGGLFPYTIYQEDETTPLPEPFYLLNFGAQKDSFVPEAFKGVGLSVILTKEKNGRDLWDPYGVEDHDIALTSAALSGPDLWFEPKLRERIFMSGKLHDAILEADTGIDFRFKKVRIV